MIQSWQLSNLVFPFQGKMIDEKKTATIFTFVVDKSICILSHTISDLLFIFAQSVLYFMMFSFSSSFLFFILVNELRFTELCDSHSKWANSTKLHFICKTSFNGNKKLTFDIHTLKMASDMFGERKKKLEQRFWAN